MRKNRRKLLVLAGALGLAPGISRPQDGRKYRLGVLASNSPALRDAHWVEFFRRLSELGLVEGRNLTIERRVAENRLDRLPALAAELAKLRCDAFFSGNNAETLAVLAAASPDTPIVAVAVDFDPVATGDVASLARPGGRVTGVTAMQSTMPAKRLELLKELIPGIHRIAVFTNAQTSDQLSVSQGTARRMGLALHVVDFRKPPFNYESGFASAAAAKAEAVFVLGSGLWVPARKEIVDRASNLRLPSVFHHAGWVEAGGLMSYGFSFPALWRRGAEITARVLRGAKAGEIPMEQPSSFELALNLATARKLGLTVPQSLLVRAERIVE